MRAPSGLPADATGRVHPHASRAVSRFEEAPVYGLTDERVPARALLISGGALAVPVAGALLAPEWVDGEMGLLVWLSALVPAFLLTYYRGWRGTSVALAGGMAALALGQAALAAGAASPPSWGMVMALVTAFLAISLGIGWVGELLHQARRDAQAVALLDALTGLPNRRHLEIFLEATYAAALRGGTLAVVVFDLDRFKEVNDRRGHAAGDAVLRTVGRVLLGQTRQSDVTVRFGGEEFVSVLPGADEDAAVIFAERVAEAVRTLHFPWGGITVSAGVAQYDDALVSPDLLLAEADRALYAAKDGGRDRVVRASSVAPRAPETRAHGVADAAPTGGARGRVLLVKDDVPTRRMLGRALERSRFEVAAVADGRAALDRLALDPSFDVVLADVVMPGMGGLALAERVSAERRGVAVLLMSGYEHAARSADARPPGVSGFLRKPITLTELATQLDAVLRDGRAGGGVPEPPSPPDRPSSEAPPPRRGTPAPLPGSEHDSR